MKKLALLLIIALISSSCSLFSKKWPQDAYTQLYNNEGIQTDCHFIEAITHNSNSSKQYISNLLESYQTHYPNYADFEKAVANKDEFIDNLRMRAIQNITHNYQLNAICNIITQNNEAIEKLKQQEPLLYNRLESNINSELKSEFVTLSAFIERAITNWDETDKQLQRIAQKSIQPIMDELEKRRQAQIEREKRITQQLEYLTSLDDLFTYNSFYSGGITMFNKTSRDIYVNLAFYFYGKNWDGWVVAGFKLMANQRNELEIPLSPNGYLNRYFYYCAKDIGSNYWSWGDLSAGHSFLTINTNESYCLPYADQSSMYTKCDLITEWNRNFRKIDIGSDCRHYTLNIVD